MTSRRQFSPLCDLHHTSMQRLMVEGHSEDNHSYHACERRGCTRIFRDATGYLDLIEGEFDDARTSVQTCPRCSAALYLAEVDHAQKIETWECPQNGCNFSEEYPSPSAR